VPGLRRGIVDPHLKHRESALQLLRAASSTFRRRELGLQSPVDLDRETGSRQFGMDLGHLQVIPDGYRAVARAISYGESVGQDKPPLPGQRGPAGWFI
jgi:hypothetical protein